MPTDGLDWHGSVAALQGLEGRDVVVRIALRHRTEELVAVFQGRLGPLSEQAKQPSLFWSVGPPSGHPEQPGVYLREADFVAGERRAGGILVVEEKDLVLNVRPLDR
jgi:hypothetical protein